MKYFDEFENEPEDEIFYGKKNETGGETFHSTRNKKGDETFHSTMDKKGDEAFHGTRNETEDDMGKKDRSSIFGLKKHETKKFIKKDYMVIMILSGILLLVIAIPTGDKKISKKTEAKQDSQQESQTQEQQTGTSESQISREDYCEQMEQKLENLLTCVEGVGRVNVMITLQSTQEQVVEKDIPGSNSNVSESDSGGGSRSTSEVQNQENTVYTIDEDGNKIPYVIKTNLPTVQGVTVVAQGGGNAVVQKNISDIAQALFHIEADKIKVAKMKSLS